MVTGLGKAKKDPTLTLVPEVGFTSLLFPPATPVHPLFGKHHAQGQGRTLIWKLLRLHHGALCGPANSGQLITGIMQRPGEGPAPGVYTVLVCLGPANPCQMLMELHHFSAEVASLGVFGGGGGGG